MGENLRRLAHRIESAAWHDLLGVQSPDQTRAAGISCRKHDGIVTISGPGAGPMFNRALAAGCVAAQLAAVHRHFQRSEINKFFIHVDEEDCARLDEGAQRLGLVHYRRSWLRLARPAAPVSPVASALTIAPATAADMLDAPRVYCRAFDAPEHLWPVFSALLGSPSWECMVVRDGGRPVGMGLLFVDGDIGYLAGGAIDPGFRRRGAHRALMAARLRRAFARGCRWVMTETGEPVPGDAQHSYRNMLRCGFQRIGRTVHYAPPQMVWSHGRRQCRAE